MTTPLRGRRRGCSALELNNFLPSSCGSNSQEAPFDISESRKMSGTPRMWILGVGKGPGHEPRPQATASQTGKTRHQYRTLGRATASPEQGGGCELGGREAAGGRRMSPLSFKSLDTPPALSPLEDGTGVDFEIIAPEGHLVCLGRRRLFPARRANCHAAVLWAWDRGAPCVPRHREFLSNSAAGLSRCLRMLAELPS